MNTASSIDPQAGFVVAASSDFVNFNEQTLIRFYQPILEPVAFSLYFALKSQVLAHPTLDDRRLQSRLLVQVNAGATDLGEGLQRLEGVGLIQTYYRHDAQGDVYVYQLHPPLTPEQFIADDLLSILLLEAVGEDAFKRLTAEARKGQLLEKGADLKNVSHRFFDQYHLDQKEVVNTPAVIKQARQKEQSPLIDRRPVAKTDFDWPTLVELLNNQPLIQEDLVDQQKLIEAEHQLYGIDEPTMAHLIERATDLATNHFNAPKFKRIVAAYYRQAPVKKAGTNQEPASSANNKEKGLTTKDQALLRSAAEYSPVGFLQALKEQTGGYVTGSERNILSRLVNAGQLPSQVINILTWYVVGELGNATLRASFVDAIANSWIRAGVTDGGGALKQLKSFNKDQSKRPIRYSRKNRQLDVREKMPQWSQLGKEERNKKASPAAIAKAKARLKKRK